LRRNDADHIERCFRPQSVGPGEPLAVLAGERAMRIRTRKLFGTVALLVLVPAWALIAMALAQVVLADAGAVVAAFYYFIAGVGWVLLAMPLVSWMSRPDRPG
jgi:hypothetical protein